MPYLSFDVMTFFQPESKRNTKTKKIVRAKSLGEQLVWFHQIEIAFEDKSISN